MPTNLRTTKSYGEGDISVLATEQGLRSPRMRTIDLTKFLPDADGNQILKAGTVIIDSDGGYGRPLTQSRLGQAITTASTSFTIVEPTMFIPGEVLVVARPYARLDLALTWANGDTATVTLDGVAIAHTVADYTTLTALAADIAETLNANPFFASKALAISENQYIHLFSNTNDNPTIAAGETTVGTGTLAVADSVTRFQPNVSIGTIATDGIDVETELVTLTGTAARRLPLAAPVGVAIAPSEVVGMILTTQLIGSTQTEIAPQSNDVACYTSASVYGARLPVWNAWLQQALPEITLV